VPGCSSSFSASFFVLLSALVGAGVGGGSLLGYQCAGLAPLLPWTDVGKSLLGKRPLMYLAIFLSGLINPLLIVTMILGTRERFRDLFAILRNTVLGMVPFLLDCILLREGPPARRASPLGRWYGAYAFLLCTKG
jgi:hypothetical protein